MKLAPQASVFKGFLVNERKMIPLFRLFFFARAIVTSMANASGVFLSRYSGCTVSSGPFLIGCLLII